MQQHRFSNPRGSRGNPNPQAEVGALGGYSAGNHNIPAHSGFNRLPSRPDIAGGRCDWSHTACANYVAPSLRLLNGIAHLSTVVHTKISQIFDGFRGKESFVSHSGYIVAKSQRVGKVPRQETPGAEGKP